MIIEQEKCANLDFKKLNNDVMLLEQIDSDYYYGELEIDTTGAKQLMRVLQEFVDENQD